MIHKIRFHSKRAIEKAEGAAGTDVVDEETEITKIENSADFEKHCYDVISATIAPELLVTVSGKKEKRVAAVGAIGTLTAFRFTKLFNTLSRHGFFLDVLGKKSFGVSIPRLSIIP